MLKTFGYLVSIASVILLGVVAWKTAAQDPLVMVCLILGMAASAAGMFLRWLSYQLDEHAKRRKSSPVLRLVEHGHLRRSGK